MYSKGNGRPIAIIMCVREKERERKGFIHKGRLLRREIRGEFGVYIYMYI